MNCYVCDQEGNATAAVASCKHCGVALCGTHFDEDMHQPRLRGMVRSACSHIPTHKPVALPARAQLGWLRCDPAPVTGTSAVSRWCG